MPTAEESSAILAVLRNGVLCGFVLMCRELFWALVF
jgi:hypothetical protein